MPLSKQEQGRLSREKGLDYEVQIRQKQLKLNWVKNSWLWDNVPEHHLIASGLMGDWNKSRLQRKKAMCKNKLPDVGCDIVNYHTDGNYEIVQCKNEIKTYPKSLAGFFMIMMQNVPRDSYGKVYHTGKLSTELNIRKNTNKYIRYFKVPYKGEVTLAQSHDKDYSEKLTLRDYQEDAVKALDGKHRSILQMPCGTGKTLVAIERAKNYDVVVVFTPLRQHCQQNMKRFESQLASEDYHFQLVDSDSNGVRDTKEIKKIIKKHKKLILFATYKSVDVINEIDSKLTNPFFIWDEPHNFSQKDVYGPMEEDDIEDDESVDSCEFEPTEINKLLNKPYQMMFMTATPRLFGDKDDEGVDVNEELMGKVEYSYEMGKAIKDGNICDYEVIVPTLTVKRDKGMKKMYTELQEDYSALSSEVQDIAIKCRFIIRGCRELGSYKCIVYCRTQEEAKLYELELQKQNLGYFHYPKMWSGTVTGKTSRKEREKLINEFSKSKSNLSFLCSVHILDECVDIPACDSIFITYPSRSKTKNIQRTCRANRLDSKNPNKISRIFLWVDEFDNMASVVKHLKEYDSSFCVEKVKLVNPCSENDMSMKKTSNDEKNEQEELKGVVVSWKRVMSWDEKLELVKKFIDENERAPKSNIVTERHMFSWIQIQIKYYGKNTSRAVNSDANNKKWTLFISQYKRFINNMQEKWDNHLEKLKIFITEHNRFPSARRGNTEKKLLNWYTNQCNNYHYKKDRLKYKTTREEWNNFTGDRTYNVFFPLPKLTKWKHRLEQVMVFIDTYKKRPPHHANSTTDNNVQLGQWLNDQLKYFKGEGYKNRSVNLPEQSKLFHEFLISERYSDYFQNPDSEWNRNLKDAKLYLLDNKRRPSQHINGPEGKLGRWLSTQISNPELKNYSNRCQKWNQFMLEFAPYMTRHGVKWVNTMEMLKTYICTNKMLPSYNDDRALRTWCKRQGENYYTNKGIMANNFFKSEWEKFISDEKYSKYFN